MGLFLFLFLSISISLASEGPVLKENSWDKPKTAVGRAKGDNLLKGWRQGLWRFWVTFARTAEIGILSCCCFLVCFRFYVYLHLSPCGWGTRHNRRPIVVQQVWTVKSALGFDEGWLHGRTASICMYCKHCVYTLLSLTKDNLHMRRTVMLVVMRICNICSNVHRTHYLSLAGTCGGQK